MMPTVMIMKEKRRYGMAVGVGHGMVIAISRVTIRRRLAMLTMMADSYKLIGGRLRCAWVCKCTMRHSTIGISI